MNLSGSLSSYHLSLGFTEEFVAQDLIPDIVTLIHLTILQQEAGAQRKREQTYRTEN